MTKRSILAWMVVFAGVLSVSAETTIKAGIGRIRPLTYMDDRGRPAGFVVDVLKEAARREKIPIAWVKFASSQASEDDLEAGRIDLLPAGMVTRERQQRFYVSEPWWSSEIALISREAVSRVSRLAISPIYDELARPAYPSATFIPEVSLDHRIADVCAGRADAALLTHGELHDVFLYRDYLNECNGVRLQSGDTQLTIELAVIARKPDVAVAKRLRDEISAMALDGTLLRFAAQNPPIPTSEVLKLAERVRQERRNRIWIAASIVALLLALCIAWLNQYAHGRIRLVRPLALSLLSVTAATALRFALEPLIGLRLPLIMHVLAVAVVAQYEGLATGLLATLLGALSIDLWFTPRSGNTLIPERPEDYISLGMFIAVSAVLSVFGGHRRRLLSRYVESEARLVKAREQLRLKHEFARIGTFDWNVGDNRVSWSPELSILYGYEPGSVEASVETWRNRILHPDDANRAMEEIQAAIASRQASLDSDFRIVRPDGEVRWLHGRSSFTYSEDGAPRRMLGVNIDITDQKRAEEELRETNAQLEAILESIPEPMMVTDADGTLLRVNAAFRSSILFQTTVDDYIGRVEIYTEDGRPIPSDDWPINRVRRGETVNNCDVVVSIDDVRSIRRFSGRPVMDGAGRVTHAIVSFFDITDQKRTAEELRRRNEELRRAEMRLRLKHEVARIGTFEWSVQDDRLAWSPEMEALYGISSDSHDHTFEEWQGLVHPEDLGPTLARMAEAAARQEPIIDATYRIIGSDGAVRWIHSRGRFEYDGSGQPVRMLGANMDVTEIKTTEQSMRTAFEELRAVFDVSPTPMYAVDADHKVVYRNRAHKETFPELPDEPYSVDQRQSVRSFRFRMYADGDEPIPFDRYPSVRALRGEAFTDERCRIENAASGITRECTVSGRPIREPDGRVSRAVIAIHDITHLRRTEEDLRRSNEELQAFAYTVSHDLAEPLRQVTAFSQMLIRRHDGDGDKDSAKILEFINAGASRMNSMIESLLQYSRIGSSDRPKQMIDCNEVMEAVLRDLRMKIEDNNAVVHVAPLPTVWAWPGRIDQVFQNLLQNAIKYRKTEVAPEIHVQVREKPDEWVFAVQDNGIGFEQRNADKIFSLFKQLHARDKYEGMGMGLAIVKRIVERHGGQVCAESAAGVGSTFYFTLPKPSAPPAELATDDAESAA